MKHIKDIYSARYRAINQEHIETPLFFRRNARKAMAAYPKKYRKADTILDAEDSLALPFYLEWKNTLIPITHTIQTADTNKKLLKEVKGSYVLSEEKAIQLIIELVDDRINIQHQELVAETYVPGEKKARVTATNFLRNTEQENLIRIDNYITFQLYRSVAKENGYTIHDQHASALKRSIQGRQERIQIKKYGRQTQKQIAFINDEITQLESENNGLIASLFSLRIDLVAIRASFQRYEKSLLNLSKANQQSPAKRLTLYQKETAAIRTAHLDTVSGMQNLQDIQHVAKEIDTVLARIFDLSTVNYNELMVKMKTYRNLTRERTSLEKSLKTTE